MASIVYFIFLLANIWIWKIFQSNLFIGIACLLASWVLSKSITNKKINVTLVLLFFVLVFFQVKTTTFTSLYQLNQQEKLLQIQRMKEYPPVHIRVLNRDIWIPAAHWLEERRETLSVYRIQKNLTDAVSLNLYFFTNHPNERIGVKEFEKFPYVLLPFFLMGLLNLDYKKNLAAVFLFLIVPLIIIAVRGQNDLLGPFSLFPAITVVSFSGIKYVYESVGRYKYLFASLFGFSYVVILLQTILYERF